MQKFTDDKSGIKNDHEYHDMSERLRIIERSIIHLIMIREEYEQEIKEYLRYRDRGLI